jgi:hypothetical protein
LNHVNRQCWRVSAAAVMLLVTLLLAEVVSFRLASHTSRSRRPLFPRSAVARWLGVELQNHQANASHSTITEWCQTATPRSLPDVYVTVQDPTCILSDSSRQLVERLVAERVVARRVGDYATADDLLQQLRTMVPAMKESIHFNQDSFTTAWRIAVVDHAAAASPGEGGTTSSWTLQCHLPSLLDTPHYSSPSIIQCAHAVLGWAASSRRDPANPSTFQVQALVDNTRQQLQHWYRVYRYLQENMHTNEASWMGTWAQIQELLQSQSAPALQDWLRVEAELSGRSSADAAFWFALAGVVDGEKNVASSLYSLLLAVATKELRRYGHRPSCRISFIHTIVHRFAAAGLVDEPVASHSDTERILQEFGQVVAALRAAKRLETPRVAKQANMMDILQPDEPSRLFDLHAPGCALMIWKFATRQKKQRAFLETAVRHWEQPQMKQRDEVTKISVHTSSYTAHYNWAEWFSDSSRPLVVDLGCGMGISVLGLATTNRQSTTALGAEHGEWSQYNYLGVDLGRLGIGYAHGLASRWGLVGRNTAFVVDSAASCLQAIVNSYPGPVAWVLIQFPTPYRLAVADQAANAGNSQLPISATDGFMASRQVLELAKSALQGSSGRAPGRLLLQSNCEDVAVYMLDLAQQVGFKAIDMTRDESWDATLPVQSVETQRTKNWVAMGGKRAVGPPWRTTPLLPNCGWTETEVTCTLDRKAVHRVVAAPD